MRGAKTEVKTVLRVYKHIPRLPYAQAKLRLVGTFLRFCEKLRLVFILMKLYLKLNHLFLVHFIKMKMNIN